MLEWEDAGRQALDGAPGGIRMDLCDGYAGFLAALKPGRDAAPDWAGVAERGVRLLTTETKDLRLLNDMVAALWMSRGWIGLRIGLRICEGLLGPPHWPDHVWPRADEHRIKAIESFVHRAAGLVEGKLPEASERDEVMAATDGAVRAIEATGLRMPSVVDVLRKLHGRMAQVSAAPERAAVDRREPPREERRTETNHGSMERHLRDMKGEVYALQTHPVSVVSLQACVVPLRRPIWRLTLECVRAVPEFTPPWRLARELAWRFDPAPPRVGVTDLTGVRRLEQATRDLAGLTTLPDLERVWEELELVWWLDPHRACVTRLRQQGANAAADAIETCVVDLVGRVPEVVDASLASSSRATSGVPLVGAETRRWIDGLSAAAEAQQTLPVVPLLPPNPQGLNIAAGQLDESLRLALTPSAPATSVAAMVERLSGPMGALLDLLQTCDPLGPATMAISASWGAIRCFAVAAVAQDMARVAADSPPSEVDTAHRDPGALWEHTNRYPASWGGWKALYELARVQRPAGARALASALTELVRGMPALRTVQYGNGAPLISADSMQWLDSLAPQRPQKGSENGGVPAAAIGSFSPATGRPSPEPPAVHEGATVWDAGLSAVAGGRLLEGLQALEAVSKRVNGERHRFEGALRLADVLLQVNRPDLALPILEHLADLSRRFQVDVWDPDLAAHLTHSRMRTLQSVATSGTTVPPALAAVRADAARQGLYSLLETKRG